MTCWRSSSSIAAINGNAVGQGKCGPLDRDLQGGDFEQIAGSVLEYAAQYSDELKQALTVGTPRITWLNYDWALNDKSNAK